MPPDADTQDEADTRWWAPYAFAAACTSCIGLTAALAGIVGIVGVFWTNLLLPSLILLALSAWVTRGFGYLGADDAACEVPEDAP